MEFVRQYVNYLFEIFIYAIFIRVLLNLLRVNSSNRIYQFLISITDPILNVAKKVTPRTGYIDLSPLIALIGLEIIRSVLFIVLSKF